MEQNQGDPEELVFVSLLDENMDIQDAIDVITEDSSLLTTNTFKDQLISTVKKLYEIIDFLKDELEEKNLLARTLLLREANDDNLVDESLVRDMNKTIQIVETTSNSSTTESSINSTISSSHGSITTVRDNNLFNEESSNDLSMGSYSNENVCLNSTYNTETIEEQIHNYQIKNMYLQRKECLTNTCENTPGRQFHTYPQFINKITIKTMIYACEWSRRKSYEKCRKTHCKN